MRKPRRKPKKEENSKKQKSILEHRKEFGTVKSCLWYLLKMRNPRNGICINPWCTANTAQYYAPLRDRTGLICRRCLAHIYPMVDSLMQRSHIPVTILFEIVYLMLASRNAIAAKEVERHFALGYPAVFRIMHDIRDLMGKSLNEPFKDTVVEIDESYISTGTKGLGRKYRFKAGRSNVKNSNILVITERVGRASLFVIPSSDEDSIMDVITKHVKQKSIIITDDWKAYNSLTNRNYVHLVVKHSDKQSPNRYKEGMASTNNAECIFSIIKRSISGTYRKITDPYLTNYLNEYAYRFNHRFERDYGFQKLFESMNPLTEHYSQKFNKADYPSIKNEEVIKDENR